MNTAAATQPDSTLERAQFFVAALTIELRKLGHTVKTSNRYFDGDQQLVGVPDTVDGIDFGIDIREEGSPRYSSRFGHTRLTCTLGQFESRRYAPRGRQAYREPNAGYSPVTMAVRIVKIVEKMKQRAAEDNRNSNLNEKADANFRALLAIIDPKLLEDRWVPSSTTVDDVDYAEITRNPTQVRITIEATNEEALAIKAFLETLRA